MEASPSLIGSTIHSIAPLPHSPSTPRLPTYTKVSKFSFGSSLQSSASFSIDSIQRSSRNGKRTLLRTSVASSYEREYVNEAPVKVLRRILDSPGVHQGPACFDALSAKLVERAGFQYCFTSGMQFYRRKDSLCGHFWLEIIFVA